MPIYCAFLRAINVGGHTVKMEQLRALFAELGYQHVTTVVASGNVIFSTPNPDGPAVAEAIAAHLHAALGYAVDTFVRSAAEVQAIAAYAPFPAEEMGAVGASLYIAFLAQPPTAAQQAQVLALQTPTDRLHFHARELYWLCRTKMSESPLFAKTPLEKRAGVSLTVRNSTTVRKVAAKVAP
jgi:uncharacterized protein (DUF1697 family)